MEVRIMDCILAIDAGAKCNVYDNDIERIEWESQPISKEDILAKKSQLESKFGHYVDRKYPEIGDQLDALFHAIDSDSDLKNKFSEFHSMIKEVKDKYPRHK